MALVGKKLTHRDVEVEARSEEDSEAPAASAAMGTCVSSEASGCKWSAGATLSPAIFGCSENRFSTSQKRRVEETQVAANPRNIALMKTGNEALVPSTTMKTMATALSVRP